MPAIKVPDGLPKSTVKFLRARERLNKALASVEAAKEKQRSELRALLESAPDDEKRLYYAGILYWYLDVTAPVLAEAYYGGKQQGLSAKLLHLISHTVHWPCTRCSKPMRVMSKNVFEKIKSGQTVCETCRQDIAKIEWDKRNKVQAKQREEEQQYLRQLRAMPYQQYLQTDYWREFRADRLRAVGYRCQVCNRQGCELHVHHRTYERCGEEYNNDVIVLCDQCHQLFHEQGRLVDPRE